MIQNIEHQLRTLFVNDGICFGSNKPQYLCSGNLVNNENETLDKKSIKITLINHMNSAHKSYHICQSIITGK